MAYVRNPLPIFGSEKYAKEFLDRQCSFDEQGLWRGLETVLLPGSILSSLEETSSGLYKLSTSSYPSSTPLYTLAQFRNRISNNKISLPSISIESFLERIAYCCDLKIPYLWGGNLPLEDPELLPVKSASMSTKEKNIYTLRGVDCSGLIYWASHGATARNSSELIKQGNPVPISSYSEKELLFCLKPGMLIGWKGHVLIVTKQGIIESCPATGVINTPAAEKIPLLLKERRALDEWPDTTPQDPSFVVRDLSPILF